MRALQFGLSGAFALLFLILGPGLWAADIPITIVGATQTQIVASYAAEGACTITVTDNNGGTNPPRDLDAQVIGFGRQLVNQDEPARRRGVVGHGVQLYQRQKCR